MNFKLMNIKTYESFILNYEELGVMYVFNKVF